MTRHALSAEDWAEIYYALDSKITAIHSGKYGDDPGCEWQNHLRLIMQIIGPDGSKMVAV